MSTLTLMIADAPLFAAASYALACSECAPLAAAVLSQLHAYGEVVSVDASAPSRRNSTRVTPTLSLAVAVTVVGPVIVAPLEGAVSVAVGAVVSPPPPPPGPNVIHIGADQASCPSSCTT